MLDNPRTIGRMRRFLKAANVGVFHTRSAIGLWVSVFSAHLCLLVIQVHSTSSKVPSATLLVLPIINTIYKSAILTFNATAARVHVWMLKVY